MSRVMRYTMGMARLADQRIAIRRKPVVSIGRMAQKAYKERLIAVRVRRSLSNLKN